MRTDIPRRTFPYQRHEVRPPEKMFVPVLCAIFLLALMLYFARSMSPETVGERVAVHAPLALILFGCATLPFRAGYGGMIPGRAVVFRGATWIVPKPIPLEQAAFLGGGLAAGLIGAMTIAYVGLSDLIASGSRGIVFGPGFLGLGIAGVAIFVWIQLRGIKLTPESITYWRGIGRITLAWDELGDAISTNDVRDHEGRRPEQDKYLPGAKIVVPVERVEDVRLPVHWEDADTPRLLLETDHFAVEPSALLTAILALRDNPELRPLLGTRDSRMLFTGPSWRVRRKMYRPQQWWPKGAAPEGVAVDSDGVVRAHL